jgi:hypothetical protein
MHFLFRIVLKQGDALLPLLFIFSLEYAIRKVIESDKSSELFGTHQFLIYANDVNMLVENTNTIKKNTYLL